MKRKDTMIMLISLLLVLPLLNALPPLPTEFYGNITTQGSPAPIGGVINAYDPGNVLCGSFAITKNGLFGLLTCRGDDPYTLVDEGPTSTEQITFKLNGKSLSVIGDGSYDELAYKELFLGYVVCGDYICEQVFEKCGKINYCPTDCPTCPNPNATTNTTQDTGGLTGPTDTAPSDGGGASGGGGGGADSQGNALTNMSVCQEEWTCYEWDICYENETQIRTCVDQNSCETYNDIPPILQECIYEGTCFDEIRNGLEEGIDCGGLCSSCPWDLTPDNCFDGRQNNNEKGVDCGGPCEKECEKKKPFFELPIEFCEREVQYFNPVYWILILSVIFAIGTDIYRSKKRLKMLKDNEFLDDLLRAKETVHTQRNMYVFSTLIIIMALILIGYYHYFSQCQSLLTDLLWLLIVIFIMTPIIGYSIIKSFEINERKRIMEMEGYFETHHSHIKGIIAMHNKYLIEIENDISNDIYQLTNDPDLKPTLEEYPELKNMYKEMITLYDKYKENPNPMKIEQELCQNMYDLINNKEFVTLTEKIPRIKTIYDNITLLYKQYEEKQKMYDELYKKLEGKEASSSKTGKVTEDSNTNKEYNRK